MQSSLIGTACQLPAITYVLIKLVHAIWCDLRRWPVTLPGIAVLKYGLLPTFLPTKCCAEGAPRCQGHRSL